MTLRSQLNLRIAFSSLLILILGGSITLWQARNAVEKEIDSSINLAVQLITFGFAQLSKTSSQEETDWFAQLNTLKETRHLSIQLKKQSGQIIRFTHDTLAAEGGKKPPQWFINLVGAHYPMAEHRIATPRGELVTLVIMANPLDEITEVWQESVAFFISIFFLMLFTFLAVHVVFNKAIRAISVIVEALKVIETGDYRQKLPEFSTQEYARIAQAINHMTEELDKTQQENRALTLHSLEIQEDERQRLSQELHDELGQSLTAIKVMAVTAAHEKADTKKITTAIIGICDHLIAVVRSMMHQLHPLILTELGLKATLEDMVAHWSERHPGLTLTLRCADAVDALEHTVSIQIFRVIQECLTNVVRHAEAGRVDISLSVRSDPQKMLLLQVRDDGKGCDMNRFSSGFGLRGMQERIKTLGGTLTYQSQPNRGMLISAHVPII
jgi:two-component system sensor histidine kinase UhpB